MTMMNTARAVGNIALAYVLAISAGSACGFLSALLFPLVSSYRKEQLQQHGAKTIFDVIYMAWGGAVRKRAVVYDCCLLAAWLCLLTTILLSVMAAAVFPPIIVTLCLGYFGGWCLTKLPNAYFAPSLHVSLDKMVFAAVYVCCILLCVQCLIGLRADRFNVNNHICIGVVLGCLANYILSKGVHKVFRYLAFSLMCSYVAYSVAVKRDPGMDVVIAVGLYGVNACLGFLAGRGMVIRTNYMVTIVCNVLGWIVWLSYSQIIFTAAKTIVFFSLQKKIEIVCVEMAHFCIVLVSMWGFLVERGFSDTYLFHIIGGIGIAFNAVICKLIQLV